jgi:cytochrome c oxidase subunit II
MKPNKNLRVRGKLRRGARFVAPGIALSLLVVGCTGTTSMLNPASVNATQVSNLTWTILAIAAFVFVVVEALLLFASFRYRRRAGMGLPRQVTGNVPLEFGWTAFPAVVLAVIFALTLGTLNSLNTPPPYPTGTPNPNQALHITVIGHQWWWEFQYPDLGITTATEMHVPVGATVYLDVETADVIHSFWIPEIGGKIDALPGHVNHIWYHVTKAERLDGQCAEFCGVEHALMRMQVVAEPPDQFAAWVKDQKAPIPAEQGQAALGESSFLAMPCVACHTIDGTSAQGKIGPNLTHFASRATFAGGSFDNTQQNVTSWIIDPQAMKPGNKMPIVGVPPGMASEMAQFLETLK